MSEPGNQAAPRLAATVLLVRDDPFEVLMLERHARAVFASALVFAGGAVDPDDASDAWLPLTHGADGMTAGERAIRIAAVRETYEESALLLARTPDGSPVPQPAARDAPFRAVVAASGGRIALEDLVPFGHWITPAEEPRRFDTHFFLAAAPPGQDVVSDGGETIRFEWARPADVIARAAAGERAILFPTLMNLMRLAESGDTRTALETARRRAPFTVEPRVEVRDDGTRAIVIPAEAGYARTEFIVR